MDLCGKRIVRVPTISFCTQLSTKIQQAHKSIQYPIQNRKIGDVKNSLTGKYLGSSILFHFPANTNFQYHHLLWRVKNNSKN
jgi:hypothetical protein